MDHQTWGGLLLFEPHMEVSWKWGPPSAHSLSIFRIFHEINHYFWDTPMTMEPPYITIWIPYIIPYYRIKHHFGERPWLWNPPMSYPFLGVLGTLSPTRNREVPSHGPVAPPQGFSDESLSFPMRPWSKRFFVEGTMNCEERLGIPIRNRNVCDMQWINGI